MMARLRLSALAQADIAQVLSWTGHRFGGQAQERYARLISAALRDLATDPHCVGTVDRPELGEEVRSFHLRIVRRQAGVARPRHLIFYRVREASIVEVGRVLHDAMELERHITFDLPPEA